MRATITMPLETLKSIIERAREYEVVDEQELDEEEMDDDDDDDDGDDEDDDFDDVLDDDETDEPLLVANDDESDDEDEDDEEEDDDEAFEDVLEGLTSEELAEILALSWIGEGDHTNWDEAVAAARAMPQDDIILQLAENPILSDAIERGLVALGYEITND